MCSLKPSWLSWTRPAESMKEYRASLLSQGASWPSSGLLARLVTPQARLDSFEKALLVPRLQPFLRRIVELCWGRWATEGPFKFGFAGPPEEEVSGFPFKGDPEMWALRVSWGPKTGVEGSAAPAHHQARLLRTVRRQRGQIGALLAASRPGTLESAGSRGRTGLA